MKTLYDLLGALPHDDSEDLRIAFRRAVKGSHPDMRPGDPDAAQKFREIVRANEILGDSEQRAVYDDLLKLAHLEQRSGSNRRPAAALRKVGSGIMALAGASAVTIGGYLLFMHMSAAPFAAVISADTMDPPPIASERTSIAGEPTASLAAMTEAPLEELSLSHVSATSDVEAGAISPQPAAFSDCYNGDLKARFTDTHDVFQPDPKTLPAYADPDIIFFRVEKPDREFPDVANARPIEKAGRSKPAPKIARKPLELVATASSVALMSQRRTAARSLPQEERLASAARLR